jgi:hypothetical protein
MVRERFVVASDGTTTVVYREIAFRLRATPQTAAVAYLRKPR